jgi:hypothetical protein
MAIKMTDPSSLRKQLRVKFADEEGIDAGGVQKEWLQLLIAELFSPKYGMFIPNEGWSLLCALLVLTFRISNLLVQP